MKLRENFGSFIWMCVLTVLLLIPCIFNTYPIVTSDSGTYIGSGIQGYVPIDRPLFYGLFVAFISFKYSLWLPIIVQSFIMAYLLFKLFEHTLSNFTNKFTYFIITLCICTTSSVAWYTSQIMSDTFVGIGFLSMLLLLLKESNKIEKIFFSIFYVMALITHNSHMLIFNIVVLLVWAFYYLNVFSLKKSFSLKRLYLLVILTAIAWLINPTINFIYEGKFKHSGAPYAFLAAKYAENGILKQYVNEKCNINLNNKYVNEGTFYFKNKRSNLFLDVEGYSLKDGAKIHQWEYTGIDNQKFIIKKQQNNFVNIIAAKSGKYVTVFNEAWGNLALKQDAPQQSDHQLFQLEISDEPNTVYIKLAGSNNFLASDTSTPRFGMPFLIGKNPQGNHFKFELLNAANCFCVLKDSIPESAMAFLWDKNSILSKTGNWSNHENGYKPVMMDIIFSIDYFIRNVKAALHATYIQLKHNNIGDGLAAYGKDSSPYFNIKTNVPSNCESFLNSEQNKGFFHFLFLNFVIQKMMMLSFWVVLIIVLVPYFRKRINLALIHFTILMFITLIVNAFVTGAMANILDRLQSRISWILPLTALLLVFNLLNTFVKISLNANDQNQH